MLNQRGALATLANVLADNGVNIQNVNIDERDPRHNTITFLLNVDNRNHLAQIIRHLKEVEGVTRVGRVK